jgi:hypothetical protein
MKAFQSGLVRILSAESNRKLQFKNKQQRDLIILEYEELLGREAQGLVDSGSRSIARNTLAF